jgi:hypothetical protein
MSNVTVKLYIFNVYTLYKTQFDVCLFTLTEAWNLSLRKRDAKVLHFTSAAIIRRLLDVRYFSMEV